MIGVNLRLSWCKNWCFTEVVSVNARIQTVGSLCWGTNGLGDMEIIFQCVVTCLMFGTRNQVYAEQYARMHFLCMSAVLYIKQLPK